MQNTSLVHFLLTVQPASCYVGDVSLFQEQQWTRLSNSISFSYGVITKTTGPPAIDEEFAGKLYYVTGELQLSASFNMFNASVVVAALSL